MSIAIVIYPVEGKACLFERIEITADRLLSRRTQALWKKKGIGPSDDGEAEDPLMQDTPWLAGLYGHGVRGRIATGPDMGKRIRTWGGRGESEEPEPSARRCANVDGFSVRANVSLRAHQRAKLEN